MLDIKRVLAAAPRKSQKVDLRELLTPWGEELLLKEQRSDDLSAERGGEAEVRSLLQTERDVLKEQKTPCLHTSRLSPIELHPHPQFARTSWVSLDGAWEYAFQEMGDTFKAHDMWRATHRCVSDAYGECASGTSDERAWGISAIETPSEFEGVIRVPFSPEAPLSGVNRQLQPTELLWYRKTFSDPRVAAGDSRRCILHFEAVDYACACFLNGQRIGEHVGGYLPFSFDITDALVAGENELTLWVYDPSDAGVQLRGKQCLERGGIWYTAQSGIWQSVWLEVVPAAHITSLEIDASTTGNLTLTVAVCGNETLRARLLDDGSEVGVAVCDCAEALNASQTQGEKVYASGVSGAPTSTFSTDCPAQVDDTHVSHVQTLTLALENPHLWSPDDPHLYQLELTFGRDMVYSYVAFREVCMRRDAKGISRLRLNGEPIFLRGVLDQGYWPDGLMTSPADDALVFDIQSMKDLGFNMLRKHIKVESDRWYYHCDRLGMLVWQDMVCGGDALSSWHSSYKPTFFRSSWGRTSDETARRHKHFSAGDASFQKEWTDTCAKTVAYLKNHPCIVTWVLFNEAWGQFHARAATDMVRALDRTRPIDAVSGWYDQRCGDFLSVHNYFRPLAVYRDLASSPRAFVISEFGGLTYQVKDHCVLETSYGYGSIESAEAFEQAVCSVLKQADDLEERGLAGFVYTQLSDVEEETNGLLTYDRRVNKLQGGSVR